MLYFSLSNGIAQVTANFAAVDSSGCVTFVASFNDQSTGAITYRLWDFGNGSTSNSNNISPSTIYTSPGTYTVSLTVSDGVDTATITKSAYITALAIPVADYTYQNPVSGCAPLQFHATDNSTFVNPPIVNWQWDFDDGSPLSSGQNVSHTYSNAGNYAVTLIVTDSMGCTDNKVIQNLVQVDPQPLANFHSTDSLSACGPPLTVNINNTSAGTTALTYNWLVGGVAYNSTNVTAVFPVAGGYDAQLITTNTMGCTDTLNIPNYVWIGSIQASMLIPDTACVNESTPMFNTSSGGSTFSWDFGDGNSGVGDSVYHVYSSPGTYTVTLIASSGANCDDTTTQTIVIESIQAAFTSSPHFACEAPLVVNFVDNSTCSGTIVGWQWNFGLNPICVGCPADTSTLQNPTNEYLAAGVYDDTLTVMSSNGCTSTIVVPANESIVITQADFLASVENGCAPLSVDFTNTTLPVANIDSVFWDYGDGSPIDTTFSPSHVFVNPGSYTVQLQVVSVGGCSTLFEMVIEVGMPQTANFAIDSNLTCASDSASFINLSTDTSLIDDYFWDFGDGFTSNLPDPKHLYVDTGYFMVTLIVYNKGCPDTLSIDSMVRVMGPIVSFVPEMSCDTQNYVEFTPTAIGGTNFYWDFGDSTAIDSTNWMATHTYPLVDSNYSINLIMYDSVSGCSDTAQNGIRVRFLEGILTVLDTTPCLGEYVALSTGNSVNALGDVSWAMNSTTNFLLDNSSISFPMTLPGPNHIYAVVHDENGCYDTLHQEIYVYQPVVSINANSNVGCSPHPVQFYDNSSSDTNIVSWNWSFGDGNTSTLQHPTHTYTSTSTTSYSVSLMVTDTFGCQALLSFSNYVTAIKPPSYFSAINYLICEYDTVRFHDAPVGNYTYLWDFGDGTTSTGFQPQHIYPSGLFTVSLTVTDSNGCSNTFTRPNLVDVQATPVANFTANPTTTVCYPALVTFTDSSNSSNTTHWTWNFGDSPNNVLVTTNTANNIYNFPGTYDVTMIVNTSYGCTDTITKPNYIHIGGPSATIVAHPPFGCVDEEVFFDVSNVNADAQIFNWDFSDGVVDTTYLGNTATSHAYALPGFYNVILLYSDSLGNCQKVDSLNVEVDQVIGDAVISDTNGCVPLVVGAMNLSSGGNAQDWLLDGVLQSQASSNNIIVSTPGLHEISLIAYDNRTMCTDTVSHWVDVYPLPEVKASNDTLICIGDTIQLYVTGADTYSWSPAQFLSDSVIYNPLSFPDSSTLFSVKGIDANNCENFDTVHVSVQQKPSILNFPPDTFIFVGAEFNVQTLFDMPMVYSWSPSLALTCSDCPNPIASPISPTTYQLTYQDVNGCFVLDTAFFINVVDEFNVYIPNSFSPDGDGLNETFFPVTYGIEELIYMRIYNRWGQLLYESTDITKGWDGTFNGQIAAHNSVFTYKLKVKRYNGDTKDYIGMVVLISR